MSATRTVEIGVGQPAVKDYSRELPDPRTPGDESADLSVGRETSAACVREPSTIPATAPAAPSIACLRVIPCMRCFPSALEGLRRCAGARPF